MSFSFDEGKFQELLQTLDQASAEALSEPILSRPAGSLSLLVCPTPPCSAPAARSGRSLSVKQDLNSACSSMAQASVRTILHVVHCGQLITQISTDVPKLAGGYLHTDPAH